MHSYTSKLRWWARCLTFGPDFIWRFVRRPTAPHHRQGRRLPTVLCVIDTHRNEDASAVKTRIMTFGSIASRQATQDRAISTKGLYNRRNKELGHSRCGPGAKISARE